MNEKQINVDMDGNKEMLLLFSRSMDRSYTAAVIKMPSPSLIMLLLKSRLFSSGNVH